MKDDYLERVLEMLGEPSWRYRDPEAWHRLENELGTSLPEDFKEIVDAYAPVQVNGHLYLSHPATDRWNLSEQIRRTSHAWSQIEWDEDEPDGDPRVSLGTSDLAFGTPDGLIPICGTDRGEERRSSTHLVALWDGAPSSSRTVRVSSSSTRFPSRSGSTSGSPVRRSPVLAVPPSTRARWSSKICP
ncbi:SMI1/KNR4 family protein [Streptomyces sp. NPDC004362]|uniref:SMI1/KNR4 family protein n=1 Tax=Streptomyces sp. NPDC004362 TaxID=3154456 RepID=UPI0033B4E454